MVLRRQNQALKHSAGSDHKVKFYTGLPNYQVLMAFLTYLKRSSSEVLDMEPHATLGRPRALQLQDEFLAVLMRMRLGLLSERPSLVGSKIAVQ